jgi:hypothetical protein
MVIAFSKSLGATAFAYEKKTYGLFQIPSTAYATSDRLVGVNGAIHYNITNS